MRSGVAIMLVLACASCERTKAPDGIQLPMPKITLKLVDAGAEPRVALRARPRLGAKATFEHTRTSHHWIGHEDRVERVVVTSDFEIISVEGDEVHTRLTTRSISVDPPPKRHDPSL